MTPLALTRYVIAALIWCVVLPLALIFIGS